MIGYNQTSERRDEADTTNSILRKWEMVYFGALPEKKSRVWSNLDPTHWVLWIAGFNHTK